MVPEYTFIFTDGNCPVCNEVNLNDVVYTVYRKIGVNPNGQPCRLEVRYVGHQGCALYNPGQHTKERRLEMKYIYHQMLANDAQRALSECRYQMTLDGRPEKVTPRQRSEGALADLTRLMEES